MKLAIPYEEGQIFQHFGKTPAFKIYDIANGQVGGSMVFPTGGKVTGLWLACSGPWASAPWSAAASVPAPSTPSLS